MKMRTKSLKKNVLTVFTYCILFAANIVLAQSTINGTVTDENQTPLPGVNIIIEGTNIGVSSDFEGNFTLNTDLSPPFRVTISSIGFGSQNIDVTEADQQLDVSLSAGQNLDEIIVSASRRPEKIQEAPSSVSVISSRIIENSANVVDPIRNLVNVPGIQIQQNSVNSLNIEMRAGSGVFGTSTFPMLDYRFLVTPAAGSFLAYQTGLSNIDIERIEVVRGAASALYGPGVTSGVVHFISKSPIDRPGTTVEVFGGGLNTFGTSLRHAWSNEKRTFGYKINARYTSGDDFTLDPIEDAAQIASLSTSIYKPAITGNQVDQSQQGTLLLGPSDLDPDGDGNPQISEYQNYNANLHLEFRPNDQTTAFIAGGFANGGGLFFNNLGSGYTQGNDYWAQARIQTGGLFAQAYYNYNDGGDDENPTFVYGTGLQQIAKRSNFEAQIQYNFDTPSFLNSNYTIGGDFRTVNSDSEYTLYGKFDDNDPYGITGLYIQGTSELGKKLDLTYALRYDKFNFQEVGGVAPRVALVYKAAENHTFRASFNRALSSVAAIQQYINFPLLNVGPGVSVWLSGQNEAQSISPNDPIDTVFGVQLPQNAPGLPLAIPYGFVKEPTLEGLTAAFQADPRLAPLAPFKPVLDNFFANYAGPQGFTGNLFGYNLLSALGDGPLTPFEIANSGSGTSKLQTLDQFELGYTGVINKKLKVSVDFYTYANTGFTNYTDVGPSYATVGANVPDDLAAAVAADVASDPTLIATVTAGVTAQVQAGIEAVYAGQGLPATGIDADTAALLGLPGPIPSIEAATTATAAPLIAQSIGGLAAAAASAFQTGGVGFNQLAGANETGDFGFIGAVESSVSPSGDGYIHPAWGYRNYGDATRSHWGSDISVQYFATDKFSLWGNTSWLSQNEWEVGDDDLPFTSSLNAPKFKYRLGMDYSAGAQGFRSSIAFQHDDEFNSDMALYAGTVQEKNLVDMNVGYVLKSGLQLDLSGTNVFNQRYRSFPGMPVIGRRIIAKATYSF
jgi:outer membrane receptor for ferrienterochelin and colicins